MHLTPLNTGDDFVPPAETEETVTSDDDSEDDDAPPMRGSILGLD
jgi:hypothetical protein